MKKLLIILFATIFLTGCSDNNNSGGSGGSAENHQIFAERKLSIDINVNYKIGTINSGGYPKNGAIKINKDNKKIQYMPEYGFIGEDSFKLQFHQDTKFSTVKEILYKISIKEPLSSDDNLDFTISYSCDELSNHLGTRNAHSMDIDVIYDDLVLVEKIYDDKDYESVNWRKIPRYSRITTEHERLSNISSGDNKSKKHHSVFKNNLDKSVRVTCNYSKGYFDLIYPIKHKNEWKAVKPYNSSHHFSRNDLYFHVSSLSDLYSKIYKKEISDGSTYSVAFSKAKDFMEKIFPKSHYTAELIHNYDRDNNRYIRNIGNYTSYREKFDAENSNYYAQIEHLANEVSNGDVSLLLVKIASEYENYYLRGKHCDNATICGSLFPNFTTSVTSNNQFKNGLESWRTIRNLYSPVTGKLESLPTRNMVNIELSASVPNGSQNPSSSIELIKLETIEAAKNVDDYFLRFDLSEAYGGARGLFGGYSSSGFAGVFSCFKDINDVQIGCLAWSDHTNKFDIAWGPARHRIESSKSFYNTRLNNVIRRVRPKAEKFIYTIHLGAYFDKYLPDLNKNSIRKIEYGLFATEFRNQSGGCYRCAAKIKANEINLLKKK